MKLDESGYKLITQFEGLSLKPYLDSIQIPTIGYGSTFYPDGKKVTMYDPKITQSYALEIFKIVADKFASQVSKSVKSSVTQKQFNALVSFAYNVGMGNFNSSTLLKRVNANPNDADIRVQFQKWNKAGGKVILGLTNRRAAEAKYYFS